MDTQRFGRPYDGPADHPQRRQSTAALALLALGIVYGDIGTSPLYAAKETFNPEHGIPLTPENILGGVSAIFWSLMIVVSLKYVTLVLRASNRGEGGIMALLALATAIGSRRIRELRAALLAIGVFGASLFYGDAVLTPAISVLSAVEGLEVGTAAFKPYVVPIATGILIALFADPAPRHRRRRPAVRPGLRALVRVARRRRRLEHRARRPRSSKALDPALRAALRDGARLRVVRRAGLGAARHHRRRGALRGHGSLRQARDPASPGSASRRRGWC